MQIMNIVIDITVYLSCSIERLKYQMRVCYPNIIRKKIVEILVLDNVYKIVIVAIIGRDIPE